jgi:uncharacterized protein (TIGR02001 family)
VTNPGRGRRPIITEKEIKPMNSLKNWKVLTWGWVISLVLILIMAPLAQAQEQKVEETKKAEEPKKEEAKEPEKPQFTLQLDALSQYVFRGVAFSRTAIVLQPSVTASYKGFAANIWGNFDPHERNPFGLTAPNRNNPKWNETDFTFSYSREIFKNFTVTGGIIYYALDSNNSPFDSFEVYGGFSYKFKWFEVGYNVYREVSHFPGWYMQWYIARSFDLPFGGCSLDLNAGWSAELSLDKAAFPIPGKNKYYNNLHAGYVQAALNIPVNKYVKVAPKIMYWYALGGDSTRVINNLSWDRQHNHILGGVSVIGTF